MRRFWQDKRGITTVEFALVAVLFLIFIFGIVDFGRAMWQWNMAAKATQWGVRYAVVHDMAAPGLYTFDCLAAAGGNGLPCPANSISPNPVECTSSGCNGTYGTDATAFNAIVARMQAIDGNIQPDNVVVDYFQMPGLGFAGNPYGPGFVPLVTVKLQNMVFSPVTPGLSGMVSITMPSFSASLTGEDLSN